MLVHKGFERQHPANLGHALRRFVTSRTIGCVKLGAGLALLQTLLRARACDTQRQRTDCQQDARLNIVIASTFRSHVVPRHDQRLPSIIRVAAAALGFLALIQLLLRPERYGALIFSTRCLPAQACTAANISAPSRVPARDPSPCFLAGRDPTISNPNGPIGAEHGNVGRTACQQERLHKSFCRCNPS